MPLILKRLHQGTTNGVHSAALLAGLRERHFGEALRGLPRLARFVECFEEGGSFWLVFRDEGVSLRDLFYSWREPAKGMPGEGNAPGAEQMVAVQPSALWLRLRLDASGGHVLRHMLRHLFEGLESLHARNVTHRDLKVALSCSAGTRPRPTPALRSCRDARRERAPTCPTPDAHPPRSRCGSPPTPSSTYEV